jgi:MYXO-CTERM domain-containing protein
VGERILLPAVREAAKETIVISDGFSCRTQIEQSTERKALHTAQVLQMAMREGPEGPRGEFPEAEYAQTPKAPWTPFEIGLVAGGAALLVAGGALLWRRKQG